MSYWLYGTDDSDAPKRLSRAFFALENAGVSGNLMIQFNDSGATFDEIADYLDQTKGCEFG